MKRNEESFGISSATLSHLYAHSIILQLTVCRNVNTHLQEEPLRFLYVTATADAADAGTTMLCLAFLPLDGRLGVARVGVPAAVFAFQFVYSFPFRIRYAIISR